LFPLRSLPLSKLRHFIDVQEDHVPDFKKMYKTIMADNFPSE